MAVESTLVYACTTAVGIDATSVGQLAYLSESHQQHLEDSRRFSSCQQHPMVAPVADPMKVPTIGIVVDDTGDQQLRYLSESIQFLKSSCLQHPMAASVADASNNLCWRRRG